MMSRSLLPAPWSERSRTVFVQSRKGRLDPNDMIAKMIELIPAKAGARECRSPDHAVLVGDVLIPMRHFCILPQDRQ